jgi:hypothetical protein
MNVVCEDIGNPNATMMRISLPFYSPLGNGGVTLHYEDRFSAAELSYWQF